MGTVDLSRLATDFRKRYDSVRMQQGRVLTDDDFNESERLDSEDERRTRLHVIGPSGSPDDGFLISAPVVDANTGVASFQIGAGTLYLGGLRLEAQEPESYVQQTDWLQQGPADAIPPLNAGERFDLVYVEAWQEPVVAVEDSELFEIALGGPDTSTRMRTVRRVRVAPGMGTGDCPSAWEDFVASVGGGGSLNEELELVPDVTLKVEFEPGGNPDDLCSPPVAGGYLGAENQAIRVQLVDATHVTWGYDNAAPLYRVQVGTNAAGQRRLITMITEPKDQAHWPLADQVVELLPWSAVLPNLEKLAELSGFLVKVDGSYNPDTRQFSIRASVPVGFGEEWKTRPDAAELGAGQPEQEYLYLRVWNRGGDTLSDPAISFTPGTSFALAQTGLRVTISGPDRRPEDFWIIAARPESPDRVVPWELEDGRGPHGYRLFYAPLAVIRWSAAAGVMTGEIVDDCRESFPPLTRLGTCCTYTVGDGVSSHGRFDTIQLAIDSLPPEGGEVCVLPGRYVENVLLDERVGVTIHGCGRRTRIVSGAPSGEFQSAAPVIHVRNSQEIRIEDLAVEADDTGIGILLEAGFELVGDVEFPTEVPGRLREVTLADLLVTAARRSAVEVREASDITIRGCVVEMRDVATTWPGIFLIGEDAWIERNVIRVRPDRTALSEGVPIAAGAGLGGIQLGGTSERVHVVENLVQGGIGNGITLGSISIVDAQGNDTGDLVGWVINVDDPCSPCEPGDSRIPDPDVDGGTRQVSAGHLYEITIEGNRILDMGLNGIGVVGFFSLAAVDEFVTVERLDILGNEIRRCLQRPLAPIERAMIESMGYGGIALADVEYLRIRENTIEDNGPNHLEPVCGIFVLHGEGVDISANRVLNNGARTAEPASSAKPGRRGGINLVYAIAPTTAVTIGQAEFPGQNGVAALKVHDNVVSAPLGRALTATALGPVTVHANQLTTRGVAARTVGDQFAAATVLIFDLGVSSELPQQLELFSGICGGKLTSGLAIAVEHDDFVLGRPGLDDLRPFQSLSNGNVLFSDNQCVLDLLETLEPGLVISSIAIASLDDVGFQDNQCDAALLAGALLTQVLLLGFSVRAGGNRLKEGVTLNRALFSGLTCGFMNVTTDNEASHCLMVRGKAGLVVDQPNTILIESFFPRFCARIGSLLTTSQPG